MSAQIEAANKFAETLQERRWKGGVRIVVQGSMRMIMAKGSADLSAGWRADVFTEDRQRKPTFILIAETPEKLLNDLAALTADWREES